MTASARSPASIHTNPRRTQDPSLLGRVPCDCPCERRSVWRGGVLLCMVLSPRFRRVVLFCERLLDSRGCGVWVVNLDNQPGVPLVPKPDHHRLLRIVHIPEHTLALLVK